MSRSARARAPSPNASHRPHRTKLFQGSDGAGGRQAGFRVLLFSAGVIYLGWWFAVALISPAAFNPLGSRLAVVAVAFAIWALSFRSRWIAKRLEALFYAVAYLITAHFFYLTHENFGDVAWPMSAYITVLAVAACFQSLVALACYGVFVIAVSVANSYVYGFPYPFFIPGLATVLLVSMIALLYRVLILRRVSAANLRFERLFNATAEGICLHDGVRILDANAPMARLFGYRQDEIIGVAVADLLDDSEHALMQKDIAAHIDTQRSVTARRRDGQTFAAEITAREFTDEAGRQRLVVVRDRTLENEAELHRIRAAEARESVRLREEFMSIASHELRTPLTPIRLGIELLRRKFFTDPTPAMTAAQALDLLQMLDGQTRRLARLVDEMLDVSRIQSGRLEIRRELFDLRALLSRIAQNWAAEAARAGFAIEVEGPADLRVEWDPMRIEQVITNLLRNAIIHSGAARGSAIRLVAAAPSDEAASFAVADPGRGIRVEDQRRIFGPFERASSSRNYGGLGLGLYISRQIVEAHGGSLELRSDPGQGTVFTAILPRRIGKLGSPTG